jgi:hypothetical protein
MIIRLRRNLLAVVYLVPGLVLGILCLEPVFRSNPTLLPRGIAAPLPVDPPLEDREYPVRYSDADIFYWQASQVRPPVEDLLEARVHWRTDEFGFPNPAPIPDEVDLVILGRSYAMGAQAEYPWPDILRREHGLRVLNLSQTGSGIRQKQDFLERFGLPRVPQFALIEVLPPKDILGSGAVEPLVIQRAVFPLAQTVLRKIFPPRTVPLSSEYIYPLPLDSSGRSCDSVFYSGYLSPLSLSTADWESSAEWGSFRADLAGLVSVLRTRGVVPILLFVPTKETVYVPLAEDLAALQPALAASGSWILTGGNLTWSTEETAPDVIRTNAPAGQELIRRFAAEQSLCVVNPSAEFAQSQRDESYPFMCYDTHWSSIGHAIVARMVAEAMDSGACR